MNKGRDQKKKKTFFEDFVLNCGWVGAKSPKLVSANTMSCLYGIFDHSKHIICFMKIWKTGQFSESPKLYGVGGCCPLFTSKSKA